MIKKICAVLLAVLMLMPIGAAGVFAASQDVISRVICCMYEDGATGRGFSWFTEKDGASVVRIVPTADFDGTFDNAAVYTGTSTFYRMRYAHKVYVTDLQPGTAYTYSVGDAKKNLWSEARTFTTDDGDSSFSFITIADVQASSDENFRQASDVLRAACETLPEAEFYTSLGDYVNDNTNQEWDWYFNNFDFANSVTTHVPVAGNHDGNITNKLNSFCFQNTFAVGGPGFKVNVEGVFYGFDYGNAHICVLNTNDMYPMGQAQRNWLVNEMTKTDATWKIVLAHRSFYSAGKNINKPDTVIMRNELLPLMDELGIDLVYAGHDHMYLRTGQLYGDKRVEGTEYITETVNGESITFAVNPEGTVYALPSTAGTKRYVVNESAMSPILDCADVALSTREVGGCFCTTQIDGGKLIYKAYSVDDETKEVKLIDTYAIMKDEGGTAGSSNLPTDAIYNFLMSPFLFFKAIFGMLATYIGMLFK